MPSEDALARARAFVERDPVGIRTRRTKTRVRFVEWVVELLAEFADAAEQRGREQGQEIAVDRLTQAHGLGQEEGLAEGALAENARLLAIFNDLYPRDAGDEVVLAMAYLRAVLVAADVDRKGTA